MMALPSFVFDIVMGIELRPSASAGTGDTVLVLQRAFCSVGSRGPLDVLSLVSGWRGGSEALDWVGMGFSLGFRSRVTFADGSARSPIIPTEQSVSS